MRKTTFILAVALAAFAFTLGCDTPPEQIARDTIAASKGVIEAAQGQYLAPCTADHTQAVCVAINKAVAAQNVAIDALHVYCAGPQYDAGGACQPQGPPALAKLSAATRQLNDLTLQVKVFIR